MSERMSDERLTEIESMFPEWGVFPKDGAELLCALRAEREEVARLRRVLGNLRKDIHLNARVIDQQETEIESLKDRNDLLERFTAWVTSKTGEGLDEYAETREDGDE